MGDFKNNAVKSMVVLRKAFRTIDAKVSESFKDYDLTPTQFAVLDVLYAKGTMKIGELISNMLATSGNMTVVIKNMEKKGWVLRHTCPNDKRAFLVSLTANGKAVIEKALPSHIHRVEESFSVLTEAEQEELIRLLKKFKSL
ncbi:MarR family winged helix-turn-helix transcriptional regulator [Streptococcus iniae]|uniref:MarR family transcriptional regulator n=2 Tax=Streptococcus iniae TaxID=1346 RepID=A0A3L8GPI8_STRIN|nr:MarR family transcriptional regulator [Streptococcus iniae]AGM98111.1 MarR family transcriptional regulator [Streptococcus iniae SF1]AHY15178.1 MarR family transcriptional regulator [Streptococcus iniae]AHY17049.1 MarR family transcriptional regulator [Streptococcus iniae]AJG25366.1 MarR family transcriptional regulator [Streptococcus iniae]APD31238.1 MarR family transcriptional regulator [Streptococcus iniae]